MKKLLIAGLSFGVLALGLVACGQKAEAPAPVVEAAPAPPPAPVTETVTLKVTGMQCPACGTNITTALTAVVGVASCVADHTKGEAAVTFDPAQTNADALVAAVPGIPGMDGKAGQYAASVAPPAEAAPAAETAPAAPSGS